MTGCFPAPGPVRLSLRAAALKPPPRVGSRSVRGIACASRREDGIVGTKRSLHGKNYAVHFLPLPARALAYAEIECGVRPVTVGRSAARPTGPANWWDGAALGPS